MALLKFAMQMVRNLRARYGLCSVILQRADYSNKNERKRAKQEGIRQEYPSGLTLL
jgi:hypothetical protein